MSPGCASSASLAAFGVAPSGVSVLPARNVRPATSTYVPGRFRRSWRPRSVPSTEPPNCRTALRGRNATYIGPAPRSSIRCASSSACAGVSFGSASGWT